MVDFWKLDPPFDAWICGRGVRAQGSCTYMYVYVYICLNIYEMYTYMYIYIYMYICIYVCMSVHTHGTTYHAPVLGVPGKP